MSNENTIAALHQQLVDATTQQEISLIERKLEVLTASNGDSTAGE